MAFGKSSGPVARTNASSTTPNPGTRIRSGTCRAMRKLCRPAPAKQPTLKMAWNSETVFRLSSDSTITPWAFMATSMAAAFSPTRNSTPMSSFTEGSKIARLSKAGNNTPVAMQSRREPSLRSTGAASGIAHKAPMPPASRTPPNCAVLSPRACARPGMCGTHEPIAEPLTRKSVATASCARRAWQGETSGTPQWVRSSERSGISDISSSIGLCSPLV
jgi:hypothetical protein